MRAGTLDFKEHIGKASLLAEAENGKNYCYT